MEKCKGNKPLNQNLYLQENNHTLPIKEQQTLIAFFELLAEIDQQNNVSKEYANAEQIERNTSDSNKAN